MLWVVGMLQCDFVEWKRASLAVNLGALWSGNRFSSMLWPGSMHSLC